MTSINFKEKNREKKEDQPGQRDFKREREDQPGQHDFKRERSTRPARLQEREGHSGQREDFNPGEGGFSSSIRTSLTLPLQKEDFNLAPILRSPSRSPRKGAETLRRKKKKKR